VGRSERRKAALGVLWRSEPICALMVYLLLAAARVGWIDLLGGHDRDLLPYVSSGDGRLSEGSAFGLLVYAYFVWRMWIGGNIAWTLSLLWTLGLTAAGCAACYQAPSLFSLGLLALSAASLLPLLSSAVLRRVDPKSRRASLAGSA
jgi:hypothetical protein